jgi:hypothetical protein
MLKLALISPARCQAGTIAARSIEIAFHRRRRAPEHCSSKPEREMNMRKHSMLGLLVVVGALALPTAVRAQQHDSSSDKPITPKTVTENTGKEATRVAKRSTKAVNKGAKDTGKQAKRAARGVKKVYSRKARQEANGEKAKKDSVKASTNP